jgi:acetyl coenzyme A synthetase (ADP forming)-like protein
MLDMFFTPQSVAVIGASREPGKLGHGVLQNIVSHGFPGEIYPVNPKADRILGLPCFPTIRAVPGPLDLAVVVVRGHLVPQVLAECGEKGTRGAVVMSAGFREIGLEGIQRERELVSVAARYDMRLLGPNSLGLIDTIGQLQASFATGMPRRGTIAFMSQSGALCTSMLDIALAEDVGFSHFVSLGNKADLNEISFLQAWRDDPHTRVIQVYVEGVIDGERFVEVAREATKKKPIVVIKSGTTSAGSRAVSSHTGTLAGSERAYEAAFRQSGVIRARSVDELFDLGIAFARQPLLPNDRIAIVTNAGGPGVMATDACERAGLQLSTLEADTLHRLHKALPAAASVLNPIDLLGDALADRYAVASKAVLEDQNVGGVLVILTPQVMTEPVGTADALANLARQHNKPVFACFMGRGAVMEGVRRLNRHGIPNYPIPERAVAAMAAMMDYRRWCERPAAVIERFSIDGEAVRSVLERAREEGRNWLGDVEAASILDALGIPAPPAELAATRDEAVQIADGLGYPVALKVVSPDTLHKTDVGGVMLNVGSPDDVRAGYDAILYRVAQRMPGAELRGCVVQAMVHGGREVIVGMNRDPQFGPLMMFGLGGVYVEALRDVAFRLAPLGRRDAREMVSEIRGQGLLGGLGGRRAADVDAIVETILKLAQLATEFPEIIEFEIDPLAAFESGQGVMALDMRLILEG